MTPPKAADLVRAVLRNRQMTQAQLAEAIGVNPVTVRHWLMGRKTPSVQHAAAIARVLGKSLDTVRAWDEPSDQLRWKDGNQEAALRVLQDDRLLDQLEAAAEVSGDEEMVALCEIAGYDAEQRERLAKRIIEGGWQRDLAKPVLEAWNVRK